MKQDNKAEGYDEKKRSRGESTVRRQVLGHMARHRTQTHSELTYAADLVLNPFTGKTVGKCILLTVDNDLFQISSAFGSIGKRTFEVDGGICKPDRKITSALRFLGIAKSCLRIFMVMCTGHVALRYADRSNGDSWTKASFSAVREGRFSRLTKREPSIPEFSCVTYISNYS